MGKKYIIPIEADPSALKRGVAEANAALTQLNEKQIMVEIDYDHGDIDDIRNAVKALSDYSPEIKVQLDYDLMSASLKQKQRELNNHLNLQKLLIGEKNGNEDLSNYISDILAEIDDGLDEGLSKIDLQNKLKKAINLAESYKQYSGKDISLDTEDFIYDLKDRLDLNNFEATDKHIFGDLSNEIKKDEAIIQGFTLQLEDLKKAGAIETKPDEIFEVKGVKEATGQVNNLSSALSNVEGKLSSKSGKIRFFDGVKEQVLDVKDDAEEINALLKKLSDNWSDVQFRTGSEFVDTKHRHDNLGLQLETGYDEPSFGNGTYFAQNFRDILTWKKNNKYPSIFASNLSDVEKMLRVESDDYLDILQDAMRSMHAYISKDLFPNENYDGMLEGISDVNSLYKAYEQQFSDLGVSQEALSGFIESQKKYLSTFIRDNKEIPKELYSAESFTSQFFTKLVGASGISTSNLGRGDSSDYGSVIFKNLARTLPYIDFGDNEELASKFAEMTLSSILKNKAKNPNVDLDEVYRQLTNTFKKDFDAKDFAKMTASSLYSENTLKSLYETLQEAKRMQGEYSSLSTKELNADLSSRNSHIQADDTAVATTKESAEANRQAADAAKEVASAEGEAADATQERIERLERLQQLQKTIVNMQPETAYGKSYEEAGQHIEKLNAQYEQTITEIEKLRAADDGSQEIKEQIGLLENLAVAYNSAINASIPNDVFPGAWISKYTNISKDDLFGEERIAKFNKIKQNAEVFRNSLNQEILDIYRNGDLQQEDLVNISQDIINTSALSEIPEIMERITSAGKEATQTMEQFHNSVEGNGGSGIGSTSDSEVESLRSELTQAEADAEAERKRAAEAEERAEWAEDEAKGYLDENTRLSNELAEVRKVADEQQRASQERISQLETEVSVKRDLYESAVLEQSESDKKATEYEELNRELQRKVSELEKTRTSSTDTSGTSSFTSANSGLADSTNVTASKINEERDAFNSLGGAAILAASNKDILAKQEVTLGSATFNTTALINKEVEALEKLGKLKNVVPTVGNTSNSNKNKSNSNNTKKDTSEEDVLKKEYDNAKNRFSDLEKYINANPALSNVYSASLQSLKNKMGGLPLDHSAISDFISELEKLKSTAEATAKDVRDEAKSISDSYKNLYNNRSELYKSFENAVKGKNTNPFQQYVNIIDELEKRINNLKSKFGDTAKEVQDAISARDAYKTDIGTFFSNRFNTDINESIDKIQKAITTRTNQGSGYIKEYREELDRTVTSLQLLKQGLASGKELDTSDLQRYIEKLNTAKQTMKGLTDQSKILATRNDIAKLLGKVTKDIKSGNLSGDTLKGYLDLQNVLRQIMNDADSAADGLTNISKAANLLNIEKYNKLHEIMIDQGMNRPKFIDQFRTAVTNQSAQFLATYFSLQDFVRYGKEVVQTVTTIDTAMTELRKVSGETDTRLAESFKTSAATAKELGATISDVINSTADWSRLGYNIKDAEELARVTQIYQNVGDNLTQETASEYLVSTLQGFQLNSDEALRVVDSINSVANNYAVDTQMIGESLERSAASFNASGTDLNKAIALVSATAEVTQDAASAGTVWKTMSARIRGEYAPIYNEDCSPHRVEINAA